MFVLKLPGIQKNLKTMFKTLTQIRLYILKNIHLKILFQSHF